MQKVQPNTYKLIKGSKVFKKFQSIASTNSQQSIQITPKSNKLTKFQYDLSPQKKAFKTIKKVKSIPTFSLKTSYNNNTQQSITLTSQGITGRDKPNQQFKDVKIIHCMKSPTKNQYLSLKSLPPALYAKYRKVSRKQKASTPYKAIDKKALTKDGQSVQTEQLQTVYKRVDEILKQYRQKQQNWHEQKKILLNEIQKYQQKLSRLKTLNHLTYLNDTNWIQKCEEN